VTEQQGARGSHIYRRRVGPSFGGTTTRSQGLADERQVAAWVKKITGLIQVFFAT